MGNRQIVITTKQGTCSENDFITTLGRNKIGREKKKKRKKKKGKKKKKKKGEEMYNS